VKIILYKTTHCPRCVELKKRLADLKINYEEKNIETDSDAMTDVLMMGKWVMPILTKDGELVDIENLEKEL
jgi:glutaredoxin-related protein